MLFALAGALALLAIGNQPYNYRRLLLVAACDFAVAVVGLAVPWDRLRAAAPALLGLPGFAVLGLSTWSFGGVAAGTGPFLVLMFAWAALHFRRRILLAFAAPATVSYVLPLVLTGQPPLVLGSAFILMPVALAVAFLIEAQARHLRDDRERLERTEKWRAAMMNTLAHDVRTPLTTVQMALTELANHVNPPAKGLLETALRQTGRISRLAESLLDVQRVDSSGHLRLDRRVHSARSLVQEAASYVHSGGDVIVEIDRDVVIYVDKQRFEQIVINLVGNALRYGKPPVVIRLSRADGVDRLEVRDHGPGIPDELRPKLFSQFAVGGPEGVGLGLWIVRQLAVAHGGQAVAEAREPGVAMVVTFPAPEVSVEEALASGHG